MMSEQRFGWNYFENEVVIGDRQDKKRMIVVVFSNFMCIPYNRKAFDELVDWLNEQQATINKQEEIIKSQDMEISRQYNLCLAMSGVLREEFGVYDVFDRTKDRKIERDDMNDF